jgi:hypothetical protein
MAVPDTEATAAVDTAVPLQEPRLSPHSGIRHRATPEIVEEMRVAAVQAGDDLEQARVNATLIGVIRHLSVRLIRHIIACNFVLPFAYMHNGPEGKWNEEAIDMVVELIGETPTMTLKELIDTVCAVLEAPMISEATLHTCKYLNDRLISYKQVYHENQMRNDPLVIQERIAFCQKLLAEMGILRCYLDETGISLGLARHRGRAPIGQLPIQIGPRNSGMNESVVCAIDNSHGVVHMRHRKGSYTKETFQPFFQEVVDKYVAEGARNVRFIMDNCRIHDAEALRLVARSATVAGTPAGYDVWFLPRYSPMLNPIEECFNEFKAAIRHLFVTQFRQEILEVKQAPWGTGEATRAGILERAIDIAICAVTSHKVQAHDHHMWTFVEPCLHGQAV